MYRVVKLLEEWGVVNGSGDLICMCFTLPGMSSEKVARLIAERLNGQIS